MPSLQEALGYSPVGSLRDRRKSRQRDDLSIAGNFTAGFSAGIDQTQALWGGLKAWYGDTVGDEDMVTEGLAYYQEQMKEASESVGDVMSYEEIEGLGDFADYAAYMIGNLLPTVGTVIGSGGAAGVAGQIGGRSAVNYQVKKKAKEAVERKVKDTAKKLDKDQMVKNYAGNLKRRSAVKNMSDRAAVRGGKAGQTVGGVGGSIGLSTGDTFGAIYEETGELRSGTALAAGIVSGSLDALTGMRALKRILPADKFKEAREKVGGKALEQRKLGERVLMEGLKSSGIEGVTEAMQEFVQETAIKLVENDYSSLTDAMYEAVTQEGAKSLYINAALAGALGGFVIGGATGLKADPAQPRTEEPPTEEGTPAPAPDGPVGPNIPQDLQIERQLRAREEARRQLEAAQQELDLGEPVLGNEPRASVRDLIGQEVTYGNAKGVLTEREDGVYVVTPEEDVFVESGQNRGLSADSLGIAPVVPPAELEFQNEVSFDPRTSQISVRGKNYQYLRSNTNDSGDVISVTAVGSDGKEVTFRNAEVIERITRNIEQGERQFDSEQMVLTDELPMSIQRQFMMDQIEAGQQSMPEQISEAQAMDIAQRLPDQDQNQLALEVGEAVRRSASFFGDRSESAPTIAGMQTQVDRTWNSMDRTNDNVDSATAMDRHNRLVGLNIPVKGTSDTYVVEEMNPEVLSGTEAGLAYSRNQDGVQYEAEPLSGRQELEPIKLALLDIASSGMPQRVIDAITGFGIHVDASGDLLGVGGFLDGSASYLSIGETIAKDPKMLRNTLAHELSHQLDNMEGVSDREEFRAVVAEDTEGNTRIGSISAPVEIDMGDVLFELYEAYRTDTPIGNYLNYPFASLWSKFDAVTKAFDAGEISKPKRDKAHRQILKELRREAFAQSSALYFAEPQMLAQHAPQTYQLMRDLTSPTQDLDNESQTREEAAQPESGQVSGGVRPPAPVTPVPNEDVAGSGRDGGGSVVQEQADQTMGDVEGQDTDQLPLDLKEVSTLFPTAVSREVDPVENVIVSNYEGYQNNSKFEQNSELIAGYNNLTKNERRRTPKARTEALIDHVVDNLLHIYDQVPQEIRDVSKLWYVGANKIANQFANEYGISLSQASGVIANLSPQKDWYMNASLAERAIDVYTNHRTDPWTDAMQAKAEKLFIENKDLSKSAVEKNKVMLEFIKGKSLQQLVDEGASNPALGMWTRTWDQTFNNSKYRLVSPDGTLLGFVKTKKGEDASMAWGSNIEIGKALSVLVDGSDANISQSLGQANKVRNFYNNIFDPMSDKGFVTIDTHAVAAGLMKPLSGTSKEVNHNFGTGKGVGNSSVTGYRGTYAVFEEAYRRAARERGILPREMQSITWEAVRGLFTDTYKNSSQNTLFAEGVWNQYSSGKLTLDEARQKVSDHAGGFDRPDWSESGRSQDVQPTGTSTFERGVSGTNISRKELEDGPTDGGRGIDAPADVQRKRVDSRFEPPPPSENSALNRAIREEDKTLLDSVKTQFRRYMLPQGLLPDSVFKLKIERDSQLGAVEIDIGQLVMAYDRAVEKHHTELTDQQKKLHNEALGERFSEIDSLGLEPEIRDAIVTMRRYIDKMSAEYGVVLMKDAQRLALQGDPDKAQAKIDILETIASNIGEYVHRSYRAFDDPKWATKVPDEVLDRARKYLEESGATNVENVINTILKDGTAYDSMEAMIRESNLGAKDLSILKQRKDIAPEIRELLGEYQEPRINFGKSVTKMSRLLFNDRFLTSVMEDGMGVYLFDADSAPAGAFTTLAAESSEAMAPLNGLKTTPEIAQAFQDALGKEQMSDWYRMVVQANGLVKYGKTVLSPTTVARNYMSAYFFTLANGHFNMSKAAEAWATKQAFFTREGDRVAYMRRLKELGVVYDSPYTGEMMKLLEESRLEFTYQNQLQGNKAADVTKRLADRATKFYQYGDDFWKIIGFENEIDILMDAKGLTREEAEPLAAERIRNTYPTYSMVGKGGQWLRRFPLAGTFVSFPAEIIRTSFNMLRYLKQDMQDPDMSGVVPQRIAGLAMASGGAFALQEFLKASLDIDDDEEEAIKLLAPPWSKNSNLAYVSRADGNIQYIDLSSLDPYSYWKRPINALLRDQPMDDAIIQAAGELLVPFFGKDIGASAIEEVWFNKKETGSQVYNPSEPVTNQVADITGHLFKQLSPGIVNNINRLGKAIEGDVSSTGKRYELNDELAALTGFRVTTLDPKVSLYYKSFEFNEAKRNATKALTDTFRSVNDVSDSELEGAYRNSSRARRRAFDDMIKMVEAARRSGLTEAMILKVLKNGGVSTKDARVIANGDFASYKISDSSLKRYIRRAEFLTGEAKGSEYERRFRFLEALEEEE